MLARLYTLLTLLNKRMRWVFWLNSVVSFSPFKDGFPLSRKFYVPTDGNKIRSDI